MDVRVAVQCIVVLVGILCWMFTPSGNALARREFHFEPSIAARDGRPLQTLHLIVEPRVAGERSQSVGARNLDDEPGD
ncbi:hypothetical protein BV25DRAFT_967373 [Artomyces pyxidatus]|uniref:Uncharacterized protein n=1 Tax=Artomyces pyxidatus TaxID=48021 RepID=A0ACB8SUR2_9AGAM|nr:hypothetical protein BV25DRAFT_967373 [Artomyces pyxidatus]